jgi:hypothetical protein
MASSSLEMGQRFLRLYEELEFVESLLSTRVAGMRTELEAMRKELGLPPGGSSVHSGSLEQPFRSPFAVDAPITVVPYTPFFPGWEIGCGPPGAKCTVQQFPAPDSALSPPDYRLIASITREDHAQCGFLSLEFGVPGLSFIGASHFDIAARLRSEFELVVRPSMRILYEGGWHDLWAPPWQVGSEFRSFSASFEIPKEFPNATSKPQAARLIYYLPSDTKLRFDLAYLLQGPRFA